MRRAPDLARRRQQALRALCAGPDGAKLNPNARIVAAYLAKFCDARGEAAFPRTDANAIDPIAMARMAGRREVFELLTRVLNLTIEDRVRLIHSQED